MFGMSEQTSDVPYGLDASARVFRTATGRMNATGAFAQRPEAAAVSGVLVRASSDDAEAKKASGERGEGTVAVSVRVRALASMGLAVVTCVQGRG